MTERQVITLAALASPGDDIGVIAMRMQIGYSTIARVVSSLKALGVVTSSSRYGSAVVIDRPFLFHAHDEGEPCHGSAAREFSAVPSALRDGCCTKTYAALDSRAVIAAKLKDAVEVHAKKRGRPKTSTRTAMLLIQHYSRARRVFTPDYCASPGELKRAARVVVTLERHHVGQAHFAAYVSHAFSVFARMKARPGAPASTYPPMAFLTSESIIDSYVSSLGQRKLNATKLAEMLTVAGLDGERAATVATIGRSLMENGIKVVPDTIREDLRASVAFFIENFALVGYED